MLAYGREAAGRGLAVIIAGAGGAAHLPGHARRGHAAAGDRRTGAAASTSTAWTPCSRSCRCRPASRWPRSAVGNARNAGLLAVRILGASDADLRQQMLDFQADLRTTAQEKGKQVRSSAGGRRLGF